MININMGGKDLHTLQVMGRNVEVGIAAEAMEEYCLLAGPSGLHSLLSCTPSVTCPGDATRSGLGLPTSIIISQENDLDLPSGKSDEDNPLGKVPSS